MPSTNEPELLHHATPRSVEPNPRSTNPYQIPADYQTRIVEPSDLATTLAERGSRYGAFSTHASLTQRLKEVMQGAPKWEDLTYDQREALEMIQHKIGRILNGDPNYADSWVDVAGYAQLVANRLSK